MSCSVADLLRTAVRVLSPGNPHLKAHIARITAEQSRVLNTLHLLEQPATREIADATSRAAEFHG